MNTGPPRRTTIGAVAPFRLDFTVAELQRLPENPVDVWHQGRYLRAFDAPAGPVWWEVSQPDEEPALRLVLHGAVGPLAPWRALVARMLGTRVDLAPFYAAAARLPIAPVVERFRGAKPPRFASLWESFVSTVLFQQLSLRSAMSALRRLVERFGGPVRAGDAVLHSFPPAERIAAAPESELRALGLSGAKARALRAIAAAVADGELREAELEPLTSGALAERLVELPGIGPWTAGLLMLRGLGRLDVFPAGDAGVERGLREILRPREIGPVLRALGSWRGMLYFHVLLRSLAERGIGPVGVAASARQPQV